MIEVDAFFAAAAPAVLVAVSSTMWLSFMLRAISALFASAKGYS